MTIQEIIPNTINLAGFTFTRYTGTNRKCMKAINPGIYVLRIEATGACHVNLSNHLNNRLYYYHKYVEQLPTAIKAALEYVTDKTLGIYFLETQNNSLRSGHEVLQLVKEFLCDHELLLTRPPKISEIAQHQRIIELTHLPTGQRYYIRDRLDRPLPVLLNSRVDYFNHYHVHDSAYKTVNKALKALYATHSPFDKTHFTIKVVAEGVMDDKEAERLKVKTIKDANKQGIVTFNKHIRNV